MKILRILPLFVLLLAGVTCYGFHFVEDFQGQPWGQYPVDTGANYTDNGVTLSISPTPQGAGDTYIGVVDSGSGAELADPFGGGAGNQSLAIHAYSTGTGVPRVNFRTGALRTGTVAFDFYIHPDHASQFHLFSTSGTTTATDYYGFVVNVNSQGLRVADGFALNAQNQEVTNYVLVNSGFQGGKAYNIEVEFFEDSTYSIYLDGVIQSTSGGKDVFDFVKPQASLTQLQFTSAWTSESNHTRYWIDNLTIIPEGATWGAMVGGFVLLLVLRHSRRRNSDSQI